MNTRSAADRPYLSIGEVLGLLLEEFPDVTISKIRFLESRGLIVPERTKSGYRKFYDEDVERLRSILIQQKDQFLPLRVIKDRLDTPSSGVIRPMASRPEPRGIKNVTTVSENGVDKSSAFEEVGGDKNMDANSDVPVAKSHPASRVVQPLPLSTGRSPRRPVPPDPSDAVGRPATYSRAELLELSGLDESTLKELESFQLVIAHRGGQQGLFDEQDLAVAEVANGFITAGVDVRHLKAWKISADREAGLFEQRVLPLLRRRSPESRTESNQLLDDLSDLGGRLRSILVAGAISSLRNPR